VICDILTWVAAFGVIIRHCLTRSPRKLFWADEVLTMVMVRDTTLSQMLASLKDTINAMPPTYFICIWLWSKCFGTSEIALRMFSCVCMCIAMLLCWFLLRTFCSRLVATTATIVTMFTSEEILFHNIEARCYSMYLAAYIAAGLFFILSSKRTSSVWIGIGAFLAHATLVSTHYIGMFYSGALIIGSAVAWWMTRQKGLRAYILWSSLGAAMAAFSIPFYLAQSKFGVKDSWLQVPKLGALLNYYQYGLMNIHSFILLISGIAALKIVCFDKAWKGRTQGQIASIEDQPSIDESAFRLFCVTILCLVSGVLPAGIWLESHFGVRLFLARYLLPSFILWPCLLGLSLERLAQSKDGSRGWWSWSCIRCAAMLVLALIIVVKHAGIQEGPKIQRTNHIVAMMKEQQLDFITSDGHVLSEVWHYGGHSIEQLKYVPSTQRKGERKFIEKVEHHIIDGLERRFWHGIVLAPDQLRSRQGRFLMLAQDREDCLEDGTISSEFQVVENLGEGLVIVEK